MYLYLYFYLYVFAINLYFHLHSCVLVFVFAFACIYICIWACVYLYIYLHLYLCVYFDWELRVCVFVFVLWSTQGGFHSPQAGTTVDKDRGGRIHHHPLCSRPDNPLLFDIRSLLSVHFCVCTFCVSTFMYILCVHILCTFCGICLTLLHCASATVSVHPSWPPTQAPF